MWIFTQRARNFGVEKGRKGQKKGRNNANACKIGHNKQVLG